MCVRGLDVRRLKSLNEVQSGGTKQKEKESRKRQSDRKKERKREGREKERKRDGGSKKLTLSFPESLTHLKTQMTLKGKVPSTGQKGGYTRK